MVERRPGKTPKKIKNVVWRNGWAYGRKEVEGVELTHALGTRDAREAEDLVREWLVGLKKGVTEKDAPLYRTMIDHFTETHLPRVSRKTQIRYIHSLLELHKTFDGKKLDDIGPKLFSEFETRRRKEGMTNATIRRDLYCLSICYTVFIEAEQWGANPVLPYLGAAKRRGLTESDPRSRFFTQEEEKLIITGAREMFKRTEHSRRMLTFFIPIAIRIGGRLDEMLKLRWRDVDFDRNEVTLFGKRSKIRTVPLLPRAKLLLQGVPRHPRSEYVFHAESGKKFNNAYKVLQDAADYVGIGDVNIHDLRRTCGVRLLRGIGIKRPLPMAHVSLWLGHSSVKVTERVYAFLSVDELHKALKGSIDDATSAEPEKNRIMDDGKSIDLIDFVDVSRDQR